MNEIAKTDKPKSPLETFKFNLSLMKQTGDLDMLPSNVSFESFRNAAIVAYQENADIMRCEPTSVFKSLRKLAAAGLVPDGREAALVPFGKACTALPMVYGMIKVVRNSGDVSTIWADVVYEGEEYKVWIEDGERKYNHVYDAMTRGGNIVGAYAVAKLKDGSVDFEPMTKEAIEKRRKSSKTQKGDGPTGIWGQWYEEMAKKTVIHSLCKRLPISSEDQRRILDAAIADEPEIRDVTPEGPRRNLAQAIQEPDAPDTPLEGEIMPEDDPTPPEYDENEVDPFEPAYEAGIAAFKAKEPMENNPYDSNPDYSSFRGGWLFQQEQSE